MVGKKEALKGISKESIKVAVKEAPKNVSKVATKETTVVTQREIPKETPKETSKETHGASRKKLKKVSKKNLRAMQRTRKKHPIRTQARIVKYGTSGFWRNIWLSSAATIVMAITLIILFVTIVASVILTSTAQLMKDKIDITVYIKPNTSDVILEKMTETIKADKNVKSVETANSEEEYAKFLEENADSDEVINILDEDMTKLMVAKMKGTMRIKVYDVDDLSSVRNIVETDDLFVKYIDEEKSLLTM